jgi:hypothetical protein
MSDVEFYEEQAINNFGSRRVFGEPELPGAVRFLMRVGIVKGIKTGYYMMLFLTVLFFAAAALIVYVYVFGGSIVPSSFSKRTPSVDLVNIQNLRNQQHASSDTNQ